MDQTQLQQKIVEYYTKLPSDLQSVFSSMSWLENLNKLVEKYDLNNKQSETLNVETTLVLLCIISIDEYVDILEKELELTEEITNKVLGEIDALIIKSIDKELVDTFNKNIESMVEEKIENNDWSQNVDFILSGDYSALLKEKNIKEENTKQITTLENFNLELTDGKKLI
jgi:hypothetical protein